MFEDAPPDHLTLFDLAVDPPARWEEQRTILTYAVRTPRPTLDKVTMTT